MTETAFEEAAATSLKPHAITWFEIPATDLDRATTFYETVLDSKLKREFYGEPMSIFPVQPNGLAGTLVARADLKPGPRGVLLYLDCTGILDEAAERVVAAGGRVLEPVAEIPGGFGRSAKIQDSEGNHISLHSR